MGAKRFLCIPMILLLLALSACGGQTQSDDELALEIRNEYRSVETCAGAATVLADYGLRVYEYDIDFTWTQDGETVLTITAPEELAGMTARVAAGESQLLFDDVQLETGPLSDGGLSPADCVPLIMDYILNGYIANCGTEASDEIECLRVHYQEPEAETGTGLEAVLWFGRDDHKLYRAELSNDGFTVIRAAITDWTVTAAEPT